MKFRQWILDNGWPEEEVERINALCEADEWTLVWREWRKLHA